jgi:hypothetical protein
LLQYCCGLATLHCNAQCTMQIDRAGGLLQCYIT